MKRQLTRRGFLSNATVGATGLVILANGRSAHSYAANEGLSFALVGCGGRGASFLADKGQYGSLFDYGRVVAMLQLL